MPASDNSRRCDIQRLPPFPEAAVSATDQRDSASDLIVHNNESDVSPPGDSIQSKTKSYDSAAAPASIYFSDQQFGKLKSLG
ncbi:hypothetical protein, partial [Mesorhizobium sp. M7A.F.Ca.CA.004.04.2.1]|uniref:hypothetical protein n=1 Tax=Mesorhizobium sp. M7A.F.Ca.CA.004.04.2.1 TaxID=2496677 RepID=UPI0019D46EF0